MLTTTITLLAALAQGPQIGQCDPVEGPRIAWTKEQRAETRARVRATCRAVKAAPEVCELLDEWGERESDFRPGVRHVMGRNENGIGPLGLSKRWHRDKWPGPVEPAFCLPEASALVALDVVRRAQVRWKARNLLEVNAVFAGRFRCVTEIDGSRECFIVRHAAKDRDICRRLEQRGLDCHAELPRRAAGKRVPVRERPAVAAELAERWAARQ